MRASTHTCTLTSAGYNLVQRLHRGDYYSCFQLINKGQQIVQQETNIQYDGRQKLLAGPGLADDIFFIFRLVQAFVWILPSKLASLVYLELDQPLGAIS